MYSPVQLAFKFFRYFLFASNGKGHGIHSPFVFEFVTKVLNDRRQFYAYNANEQVRNKMLGNNEVITIEDFGAGSVSGSSSQRKVSAIARSSLKPAKYSRLLFRIVDYYKMSCVVELGTSLGITTAYLASANINGRIYTLEGAPQIAAIAQQNFADLGLQNIISKVGNFDDTLAPLLQQLPSIDMAFIDGNHRKEPTLRYFKQLLQVSAEHTILIFDDIHWSRDMEEAWAEIKAHPRVTLTIDLFFIGLVFFRKEQKAVEHFVVRF